MTDRCQHSDCDAPLATAADDPALPDYIDPLVCPECGERYEKDTEIGTVEIDA